MKRLKHVISVAKGAIEADLVLKNCKIVNVFTKTIDVGDIAISSGTIAGIGNYSSSNEVDMKGRYAVPGLIDSHVHIESSMVTPRVFAEAVVSRGTTTVVADPHEIANVCGQEGIKYMLESSKNLPVSMFFMYPSCVPATTFETSGAVLEAKDISEMMSESRVLGLGEKMNFPGVIEHDIEVLQKIIAVENKVIDGHAPMLQGKMLSAYTAAGVKTDHECSTVEEMLERIGLGMYVHIREGSAAKNLKTLVKGLTKSVIPRCTFCTDDRHLEDILQEGHIDNCIRIAINSGIDPIDAITMATINTATCYGLKKLGAIAPGYIADIAIVDDLSLFNVCDVYKNGSLVTKDARALAFAHLDLYNSKVLDTVNAAAVTIDMFKLKISKNPSTVIGIIPNNLITEKKVLQVDTCDGHFMHNPSIDIVKLAVIERHRASGNIGLGLVQNFGIKKGAIASTIAHDSHNIIVIGVNDEDMLAAVNHLKEVGGGIVVCADGKILETLPLPIAGLMTDIGANGLVSKLKGLLKTAHRDLEVNSQIDPFVTLSFLALPVIPEIRVTDLGLFDVTKFEFIQA